MRWPPSLVRYRQVVDGKRKRSLWVPLVLVWPLAVALWVVLLPLLVLAALALWRSGKGKVVLLGGPAAFALFCALRGLRVEVNGKTSQFLLALW